MSVRWGPAGYKYETARRQRSVVRSFLVFLCSGQLRRGICCPPAQYGVLHAKDVNTEMDGYFNDDLYVLNFAWEEAASSRPLTRDWIRTMRKSIWTTSRTLSSDASSMIKARKRREFGAVRVPQVVPTYERMQVRLGGISDWTKPLGGGSS